MPTIFIFRGFLIGFFSNEHHPPHVHARGKGGRIAFLLNCPNGPVTLREKKGHVSPADQRALEAFLNANLVALCAAWEEFDAKR